METSHTKYRRDLCKTSLAYLWGGDPSKQLDCILVNPGIHTSYSSRRDTCPFEDIIPPYGLAVLASAVSKSGFNIAIIDADTQGILNPLHIANMVNSLKPRAIGLSISSPCYFAARELALNLDSDITLFIGGPHPSALPSQTLDDFSTFSNPTIIVGPGEEPLVNLLRNDCFDAGSRNSLRNKFLVPIVPKTLTSLIHDFQCISQNNSKNKTAYLLSSRGCPYKCSFCSIHSISGNKILRKPVKKIIAEINDYALQGINTIRFLDDLFIYSDDIICEFRDCMHKSDLLNQTSWYANARVDIIRKLSKNSLRAMIESGCKGVGIGVESASDRILAEVGKGFNRAEALDSVKILADIGLRIYCYFIIGFPTESYQEMAETISFADELRNNYNCRCGIVPYKLYPGTYDFQRMIGPEPSLKTVHKLSRFRPANMVKDSDPPHIKNILSRRESFTIFHDEMFFSPNAIKTELIESMIADYYRSSASL